MTELGSGVGPKRRPRDAWTVQSSTGCCQAPSLRNSATRWVLLLDVARVLHYCEFAAPHYVVDHVYKVT